MAFTILIVDDEPNVCYLLRSILELEGYNVLVAKSGSEALQILKREKVDLITIDVIMPKMDGWELMGVIRHELKLNVPIIALTVVSDAHAEKRSKEEFGVKDYITKPFDRKELIKVVKKYVNNVKVH